MKIPLTRLYRVLFLAEAMPRSHFVWDRQTAELTEAEVAKFGRETHLMAQLAHRNVLRAGGVEGVPRRCRVLDERRAAAD